MSNLLKNMVHPAGFEPATSAFGGQRYAVKLAEHCGFPWLRRVMNPLDMTRLNLKGFILNHRLMPNKFEPLTSALRILHPRPALAELRQIARKLPGFVAAETALAAWFGCERTTECCVARECAAW